ncbi:MAG TPA: hypothetical protein DG754_07735 [Bacteroidales bacterium]|nr:hypothetical protein [Bacteroidales bacterium]
MGSVITTIGTGTNYPAVRIPFNFYYSTNFSQTLYFPNEIGLNQGTLTSIAYTNNFITNLAEKNIKIWVGETDVMDLSNGWIDPETLTLVYDGTVNFPNGENNILIPLDVPYTYTGNNLVVYTNRVWEYDYFSAYDRFYGTNDEGSSRTYCISADDVLEPANPGSGTVSDWYPNTTLFFLPEARGMLNGTVTNETPTGDPVEGVEVSIVGTNITTITDASGHYEFADLQVNTYSVHLEKVDYSSHTEEDVEIIADNTTTVNVALTATTSTPTSLLSMVSAYPNPFNKQISISNPELVERVTISNLLGQKVKEVTPNGQKTISTTGLGSGIYLITFEGMNGERTVRKMIKR